MRKPVLLLLAGLVTVCLLAGMALEVYRRNSLTPPKLTIQPLTIGYWYLSVTQYPGGPEQLVRDAKTDGVSYVVVKTSDYGNSRRQARASGNKIFPLWYSHCPEPLFKRLVTEGKRQGVKVYAWTYIYGLNGNFARRAANAALAAGADGYILNAETEATRPERFEVIRQIASNIRADIDLKYPGRLLAYSTFARADRGMGAKFPYIKLSMYCHQIWLQSYHRDFRWDPDVTVRRIDAMWRQKYARWRTLGEGREDATIDWVHTAHAYGKNRKQAEYIPADELSTFLSQIVLSSHKEVNIWRRDLMDEEHRRVVRNFTAGNAEAAAQVGELFHRLNQPSIAQKPTQARKGRYMNPLLVFLGSVLLIPLLLSITRVISAVLYHSRYWYFWNRYYHTFPLHRIMRILMKEAWGGFLTIFRAFACAWKDGKYK